MQGVAGLVDGLQQAVDLVRLKQHRRRQEQGILDPFSRREFLSQGRHQPHPMKDFGIHFTGPVFADRGIRQGEQVDIGAVVGLISHLPASE